MEINMDHGENVMFVKTSLNDISEKFFFMFLVGDIQTLAMFSKEGR